MGCRFVEAFGDAPPLPRRYLAKMVDPEGALHFAEPATPTAGAPTAAAGRREDASAAPPGNEFERVSRLATLGDGLYGVDVPDGWQQGRGAFGGLVVGLLVRAIEAEAQSPERMLRALSAEIPSPVLVGETRIRVRKLRVGRGVSALEAHLTQSGEVRARASAVLGKARPVDVDVTPRIEIPPMPPPPEREPPPSFARFFEYRPTAGYPLSGQDEPATEGFIAFRNAPSELGPAELACLVDAYWPAFFPTLREPRPGGTVSFPLHLTHAARDLVPTEPLFYRSRTLTAGEGFSYEQRELWTPDGRLVALNPQTFAIIA